MTPLGIIGWVATVFVVIALTCMAVVVIAATFRTLDKERRSNNDKMDGER